MIFYILQNQITTLFLGLHLLTTMTFDSEVLSYMYGGGKDDLFIQLANNQRTLVMKASQQKLSNLLVITKKRKYYFNLQFDASNPHQFLEIKDGVINHALKSKLSTEQYDVLEGTTSLLIVNKGQSAALINGKEVKTSDYFSKGVPIFFDGRRILN